MIRKSLIASFFVLCGCNRVTSPPHVAVSRPEANPSEQGNNYFSASDNAWVLEGWTHGSLKRPHEDVSLRIRIAKPHERAARPVCKTLVVRFYKEHHKGREGWASRTMSFQPDLEQVSRQSIVAYDKETGLKDRQLAISGIGYEGNMSFKVYDGSLTGEAVIELVGRWVMDVEVVLQDGTRLAFNAIPIDVRIF